MAIDDFDDDLSLDFSDARGELERIGILADRVGNKVSNTLRGAILDGKGLQDTLSQIGRTLADITLKMALKPVGNAFAGLVNNLFTATNPVAGVAGVTKAFAKGGIVSSPSYFPMGDGGTGVMGEAGAEAILPLARGPDGRLGVRTNGAAVPIQISMTVNTPNADSFVRSQAQVNAMLARAVGRGRRSL